MDENNIIIETISSDDVMTHNKVLYNTNNHWSASGKAPDDYREVLNKNLTKNLFK